MGESIKHTITAYLALRKAEAADKTLVENLDEELAPYFRDGLNVDTSEPQKRKFKEEESNDKETSKDCQEIVDYNIRLGMGNGIGVPRKGHLERDNEEGAIGRERQKTDHWEGAMRKRGRGRNNTWTVVGKDGKKYMWKERLVRCDRDGTIEKRRRGGGDGGFIRIIQAMEGSWTNCRIGDPSPTLLRLPKECLLYMYCVYVNWYSQLPHLCLS